MGLMAIAGALSLGAFIANRVAETLRSRRANRTQRRAFVPVDPNDTAEAQDLATADYTGAAVRILESTDSIELYVRDFSVHSGVQARALVVLVHGWSWHSAYFAPFAAHLNEQGIVAVAYDLRGHGRSGCIDGIRGYGTFDQHVSDLLNVVQYAAGHFVGLPLFLFGESMGACMVAALISRHGDDPALAGLRGALFGSPVFQIEPKLLPPPPVILLLRGMSLLFPKLPLPNDVEKTFEDAFGDQEAAVEAREDPLVILEPPRLTSSLTLIDGINGVAKGFKSVTVPWLILHGGLDTRTNPANSRTVFEASECLDKSLIMYDDAKHQLFQDKDEIRDRAMNDLTTWLLKHL